MVIGPDTNHFNSIFFSRECNLHITITEILLWCKTTDLFHGGIFNFDQWKGLYRINEAEELKTAHTNSVKNQDQLLKYCSSCALQS